MKLKDLLENSKDLDQEVEVYFEKDLDDLKKSNNEKLEKLSLEKEAKQNESLDFAKRVAEIQKDYETLKSEFEAQKTEIDNKKRGEIIDRLINKSHTKMVEKLVSDIPTDKLEAELANGEYDIFYKTSVKLPERPVDVELQKTEKAKADLENERVFNLLKVQG